MTLRRRYIAAAVATALAAGLAGCVPPGAAPEVTGAPGPAADEAPAPPRPFNRQLAVAHYKLGREAEAEGDFETAARYYAVAITADAWNVGPGETMADDTPFGALARICGMGRPAAAVLRACSAAIGGFRFAPDRLIEFLGNRGEARLALGDTAGALADFETALKLDSSDPRILNARARARAFEGDPVAAIADLDRAIRRAPRDLTLRLTRAALLRSAGMLTESIAAYDAILSDPAAEADHPEAYRGRARADCAAALADAAAVDWQVWAATVPGAAVWLQDLLWWRGFLRAPLAPALGPAAVAGLRGWTEAGCPRG